MKVVHRVHIIRILALVLALTGVVALGLNHILAAATIDTTTPNGALYQDPKTKTEVQMLLTREMGSREAEVALITIPANVETAKHSHQSSEIFYVLDGDLEQKVGDEIKEFRQGQVAHVPPNTDIVHKTKGGTHLVAIWVPAGEEERYRKNWTTVTK
jgi:quercetin dioxygenase-like cupin family protein